MLKRYFTSALALLASLAGSAQTTFFHQDFSQTTGLINPQPDTSQFSHVILTAPALSYHKFHKGYMELTRTRLDSLTGGIIRAMRATPFSPNPETLIVRITLSVEGVQAPALNAMYFYIGEDFNPVNNSFPGNGLMFAKCAINFLEDGFNIKDLETRQVSKTYAEKKQVTLTWVLNNSAVPLEYHINPTSPEETAQPGTYDLWVGNEPVARNANAYPGTSAYSKTKLSNFEMRFRNGVGKFRIDEIRIDDGKPQPVVENAFVAPNPARKDRIALSGKGVNAASVRLIGVNGKVLPLKTVIDGPDKLLLKPLSPPASGMHILQLQHQNGKYQVLKLMIE
ncbi:Por secretion system C-terminal sorting domain-containing protein [Dyadobacter soli]|uniref:Por secretion system C-terminal sorting domain-containing protein n=1 Tax=Dyadobacter soli TaxID=659014 RepID=A0A1G7RSP9_9BACT|nr:T9SS type A sorting domain-containing protein [Dyadobacter soli]SDG12880.1 Por secretion system C-terminal sorting domain-containing protein [Dyadobacter soli]